MLDDSLVKGEGGFFGSGENTKVFCLAIKTDLGHEFLSVLRHSRIARGVGRRQPSFFWWIHQCVVILVVEGQSIGKI